MKKPGVRIRMKLDFVFDTEDSNATLPWVDINTFVAAGLRAVGYRKGCIEAGAACKASIARTKKKGGAK